MAQVIVTEEAAECLREIHAYIAQDNADAADRVFDGILERIEQLREYPQIGYRYERAGSRHIRILIYGRYLIAYLIKPDDNIDVIGVYHGARQIEQFLSDP